MLRFVEGKRVYVFLSWGRGGVERTEEQSIARRGWNMGETKSVIERRGYERACGGGSKGGRKVRLSVSLCRFPVEAGGAIKRHRTVNSAKCCWDHLYTKHSRLSSIKSWFRFIRPSCSSACLCAGKTGLLWR